MHSDDEVREWFASVVIQDRDVWVIELDDSPVALLVLNEGWIDQLYVDPRCTSEGLGSTLIALAKNLHPESLDSRTFESNTDARRFYEGHGFVAIGATDGENEERAPDIHYRWSTR